MNEELSKVDTVEELLELARAREKQAYDFYEKLVAHSKVGILREFALQLKDDEQRHVKLVERKLAELRSGQV